MIEDHEAEAFRFDIPEALTPRQIKIRAGLSLLLGGVIVAAIIFGVQAANDLIVGAVK